MFRVIPRLRFIEPQLASAVDQPPKGKHWIHEIKHDGYRSQVVIERGHARVFTRNGYDWSDRYPGIVRAAACLRCKSAIIDGEAIVQQGDGRSDFESLQSAIRGRPYSIILYAFDLLHLDGRTGPPFVCGSPCGSNQAKGGKAFVRNEPDRRGWDSNPRYGYPHNGFRVL